MENPSLLHELIQVLRMKNVPAWCPLFLAGTEKLRFLNPFKFALTNIEALLEAVLQIPCHALSK